MAVKTPCSKIALSLFMLSLVMSCTQEGSLHMSESQNKLPASEREVRPLLVGSAIPPDMRLRDIDGNAFDLNEAVAKMPTVLIFNRGGW